LGSPARDASSRFTTIRAELMAAGIIIEQTKDGIRWRRK